MLLVISLAYLTVYLAIHLGSKELFPRENEILSSNGIVSQVDLTNHLIITSLNLLAEILFLTYIAICTTLLYLDIRIRMEGFDLEIASKLEHA